MKCPECEFLSMMVEMTDGLNRELAQSQLDDHRQKDHAIPDPMWWELLRVLTPDDVKLTGLN
jgi:hypothetical protein